MIKKIVNNENSVSIALNDIIDMELNRQEEEQILKELNNKQKNEEIQENINLKDNKQEEHNIPIIISNESFISDIKSTNKSRVNTFFYIIFCIIILGGLFLFYYSFQKNSENKILISDLSIKNKTLISNNKKLSNEIININKILVSKNNKIINDNNIVYKCQKEIEILKNKTKNIKCVNKIKKNKNIIKKEYKKQKKEIIKIDDNPLSGINFN